MSIVAFTHYRQAQSGDVLEDLVARGFPRNEPPRFRQPSCPKLFLDLFCGKNNPLCNAVLAMGGAPPSGRGTRTPSAWGPKPTCWILPG